MDVGCYSFGIFHDHTRYNSCLKTCKICFLDSSFDRRDNVTIDEYEDVYILYYYIL